MLATKSLTDYYWIRLFLLMLEEILVFLNDSDQKFSSSYSTSNTFVGERRSKSKYVGVGFWFRNNQMTVKDFKNHIQDTG